MAAEFYHKTAALFEEFKKRELISLSNGKECNNLNWKNEYSLSTQEYLKKINQREKETEKTYKELMKNMEDLDRQTDQMSLKLEKLHALRNIALNSNSSAWPSVDHFDRPLQSYYQRTASDNHALISSPTKYSHSFPVEPYAPKFSSSDQSTQTEYLFCAQCHFPITLLSAEVSETVKMGAGSLGTPLSGEMAPENPTLLSPPNFNVVERNKRQDAKNLLQNLELNRVQPNPTENVLETSHQGISVMTDSEISNDAEGSTGITLKNACNGNDSMPMEPLEECSESIEQPTLKSDDESINHEFDFLESNKRSSVSSKTLLKVNFQNNGDELNGEHGSSQKNNPTEIKNTSSDIPVSEEFHGYNSGNMARIRVDEEVKPDSSVSGGRPTPLPSENASLASESDTSSEKDTPLTATAAYQALLGNSSSARSSQKKQPLPDSDSEDEIERALAKTVRKVSTVLPQASESTLKSGDRKQSEAEIKPKPEARSSISSNKPPSKLSKNTRKVLGLDTSSGSEMELAVAPNVSKKEEDSDEFDFYD